MCGILFKEQHQAVGYSCWGNHISGDRPLLALSCSLSQCEAIALQGKSNVQPHGSYEAVKLRAWQSIPFGDCFFLSSSSKSILTCWSCWETPFKFNRQPAWCPTSNPLFVALSDWKLVQDTWPRALDSSALVFSWHRKEALSITNVCLMHWVVDL